MSEAPKDSSRSSTPDREAMPGVKEDVTGNPAPASSPASKEEVRRITEVVLLALAEASKEEENKKEKPLLTRVLAFVQENTTLVTIFLAIGGITVASYFYEASPLYYFKQLALQDQKLDAEMKAYDYQREMVRRYVTLGTSLLDQGRFDDAAAAFDDALEIDGHSTEAAFGKQKANLFSSAANKEYDPAVIEQRVMAFLSMEPAGTGSMSDPHALAALGDLMMLAGRHDQAEAHYNEAIQLRPGLSNAQAALAHLALSRRDYPKAVAGFKQAFEQAPSHLDYRINLASALLYNGQHAEAIEHYQSIVKLDQEQLLPYLEFAVALRATKEFEESFRLLDYSHRLFFDNKVLNQKKNNGPWSLDFGPDRYNIDDFRMKYGYAYHAALFSAFLADQQDFVEHLEARALPKVRQLPSKIVDSILQPLIAEAEQLRQAHGDEVAKRIDLFYDHHDISLKASP